MVGGKGGVWAVRGCGGRRVKFFLDFMYFFEKFGIPVPTL